MRNKPYWCAVLTMVILLIFLCPTGYSQSKLQKEVLADGVERWYHATRTAQPWFFQQLQNIFDVILTSKELPFGKSVAFLVGVSEYKYLSPPLKWVKNDIQDMREFLLTKGGFDEVYVATEKIVNRDLVDNYIKNIFFKNLSLKDRFLFYYAGHGDDGGGNTGYMQFHAAQSQNFVGQQVLKIKDVETWCSETEISHLLFIFDCCASGLAFTPRGGGDSQRQLLATLSGKGSRAIFTAGTADERTFEIDRPGGKGNGIFTRAFLDALEQGLADKGKDGFMTVDEIYAHIKDHVASFAAARQTKLTPRLWTLDLHDYDGTFVFLNLEAPQQGVTLAANYTSRLGATPIPRGETVATYGIIQITAYVSGELYIGNMLVGPIESGDKKEYRDIATGNHQVTIKTPTKSYTENVQVKKGQVTLLTFQPPARIPAETPTTLPQPRTQTSSSQTQAPALPGQALGIEWASIPAGTFEMGDHVGDGWGWEKPVHTVKLTRFYMSKTEVTVAAYRAFCQATNRKMPDAPSWGWQDKHPMVNVSWEDAVAFCKWIGCQLPTEAQWEYACRAGTTTPFNTGENLTTDQANYDGNNPYKNFPKGKYIGQTTPVGSYPPNAWGLFDMHGNVWEWCQDWYGEKYYDACKQQGTVTNPLGPEAGSLRVDRGGSWYGDAQYCRAAYRDFFSPAGRDDFIGFRLVFVPQSVGSSFDFSSEQGQRVVCAE